MHVADVAVVWRHDTARKGTSRQRRRDSICIRTRIIKSLRTLALALQMHLTNKHTHARTHTVPLARCFFGIISTGFRDATRHSWRPRHLMDGATRSINRPVMNRHTMAHAGCTVSLHHGLLGCFMVFAVEASTQKKPNGSPIPGTRFAI